MCSGVNDAGDRISASESLLGGEEIDCVVVLIRGLQALVHEGAPAVGDDGKVSESGIKRN